jgi:hypothetical protein
MRFRGGVSEGLPPRKTILLPPVGQSGDQAGVSVVSAGYMVFHGMPSTEAGTTIAVVPGCDGLLPDHFPAPCPKHRRCAFFFPDGKDVPGPWMILPTGNAPWPGQAIGLR